MHIPNRTLIILILCLIPIASFSQSGSGTLHFIYVSDTNDSEIGKSSEESNRFFMQNFVPMVKKHTNLYVNTYYVTGSEFTRARLNSVVNSIQSNSNDAILFYYTGHGFNEGENDFPTLTLGLRGEDVSARRKPLLELYNTLIDKPHRLLVVVAEACNAVYRARAISGNYTSGYDPLEGDYSTLQLLFEKSSGNYLMSSSKKGEKSYCPTGGLGYFTRAFRDAIDSEGAISSWTSFLDKVSAKTTSYANDYAAVEQHPQWLSGYYSDGKAKTTTSSYLKVNNSSSNIYRNISYEGSSETFIVSTNSPSFEIFGLPSWCSIADKTSTSFKLICERNTSTNSRNDWLKIQASGKEIKITLSQDGKPYSETICSNIIHITEISWMMYNVIYTGLMVIYSNNTGTFKLRSPRTIIQNVFFSNSGNGCSYFNCSNPRYPNGNAVPDYAADNFVVFPNGQMFTSDSMGNWSTLINYSIINQNNWYSILNAYGLQ